MTFRHNQDPHLIRWDFPGEEEQDWQTEVAVWLINYLVRRVREDLLPNWGPLHGKMEQAKHDPPQHHD